MNALPLISHRVFVAAAGNGVASAKGRGRSKPGLIDWKNGARSAGVAGNDGLGAVSLRAVRSAAGGN